MRLQSCTLEGSGCYGIYVDGDGSCVDARSCRLLNNACGACTQAGGVFTANDCENSGSKSEAYVASNAGVVNIERCTSECDGGGSSAACAVRAG